MNKLTDIDLIELRDRFGEDVMYYCEKFSKKKLIEENLHSIRGKFGNWVAFVVEDMATGKEERWKKEHGIFDP